MTAERRPPMQEPQIPPRESIDTAQAPADDTTVSSTEIFSAIRESITPEDYAARFAASVILNPKMSPEQLKSAWKSRQG